MSLTTDACACLSDAHGHAPGECPNAATDGGDLCDDCFELGGDDEATQAGGYGAGVYGAGPYGSGSAQPYGGPYGSGYENFGGGSSAAFSPAFGPPASGNYSSSPIVRNENIVPAAGHAAGEAIFRGETNIVVSDTVNVHVTATPPILPAIWNSLGVDVFAQLEKVERQLIEFRAFAALLEQAKSEFGRAHNNPPGLVDAPEIDIEVLDAAIVALQMLRTQIVKISPDPTLLELIWRTLNIGARACGKFANWVADRGGKAAAKYIDNIFDNATKELGKSIGKPGGVAAWMAIACGSVYGPEKDLQTLIRVVKAVGAALGHW